MVIADIPSTNLAMSGCGRRGIRDAAPEITSLSGRGPKTKSHVSCSCLSVLFIILFKCVFEDYLHLLYTELTAHKSYQMLWPCAPQAHPLVLERCPNKMCIRLSCTRLWFYLHFMNCTLILICCHKNWRKIHFLCILPGPIPGLVFACACKGSWNIFGTQCTKMFCLVKLCNQMVAQTFSSSTKKCVCCHFRWCGGFMWDLKKVIDKIHR